MPASAEITYIFDIHDKADEHLLRRDDPDDLGKLWESLTIFSASLKTRAA